jgi:hypothetical protein
MTPAGFHQFLTDLLVEESIVHFNPPMARRVAGHSTHVAWPNQQAGPRLEVPEYSIREYIAELQSSNYTCLLPNAALIQIEYTWHRGEVTRHRYCYLPAPFDLGEEAVQPEEIEHLIDLAGTVALADVRLKTKLRFEFDVDQMAPNHPASHLHIHYPSCRIPVKSSIGVHSFFRFIFKYFCHDFYATSHVLSRRRNDGGGDRLSDDERNEAHVFWQIQ